MDRVEVVREAHTNRYSVVLVRGGDTIRCMVTVPEGAGPNAHSDEEMHRAALSAAKALAKALDAAIGSV